MKLFGLSGDRDVFRKITSHPQQAIGCELFRSLDGDMLDQRMLRVRNGELELEILVDRGFDIGRVSYRGIPTQWVSPAGFRHAHSFTPAAMEPDGWGWLRSWQGGFLSTIGVDHVGGPIIHPNRHLHPAITGERRFVGGFISISPTTIEIINVDWGKGKIEIQAKIRQAAPFAEHLVLTRRLTMNFGEASFQLHDEVRNDGYVEEPVQILYHINLGWPFLAPGTTLETSCNEMLACIDSAIDEDPTTMPVPTKEDVERVWDWNAPSGIQWARITNSDAAGRGEMSMKLGWDGDQLPHFMQWRNACEALYAQGLEPSTTGLLGRDGDNSHAGSSPNISPGDSRKFSLNFSFNSSF
jgi:Domain of unknown function (DUF4432)